MKIATLLRFTGMATALSIAAATHAWAQAAPPLIWSSISGPWTSDFNGSFGVIASHPNNPSTIFIASSVLGGPGVMKSTDGGLTWTAKNSGIGKVGIPAQNYPSITTIVVSPSNPNIIYLGTAVEDVFLGPIGSVYRSIDGGETWTKISGTQITGGVFSLDVDPNNADIAFAGVTAQGILRTSNGGATWSTIYPAPLSLNTIQYFNILKVSPVNPSTIMFSEFSDITSGALPLPTEEQIDLTGIIPSPLMKSTDGGTTWNAIGNLPQVALFTDLAYEPGSGDWYISTIAYATPLGFPARNRGIFKSTNSGQTWNGVNQTTFGSLDELPFVAMSASPNSARNGAFASTGFGGVILTTTDTGINWLRLDPCLVNAFIGRTMVAGNKLFVLTSLGIFASDISSLYQPATPTITSVSPATLPPSASAQRITIYGSNFLPSDPNHSVLIFYDPASNSYTRTPINVTPTSMQYDLNVQSATGTWKVKVMNGSQSSALFSFDVVPVNAQLTGLSISGPATVNQNGSAQYSASAIFSDGSSSTVTPFWNLNAGAPAGISSTGQLTANSVSVNTTVTITASYASGGVTKTANFTLTIVKPPGCGSQLRQLITNGNFASGAANWTLSGNFQADSRFSTCNSCPGYAYVANSDGSPGNNLSGTMTQTIQIPANATDVTLGYYYRITTSDTSGTAHDHLHLQLILQPSGTLIGLDDKSNLNANSGYGYASFNISAYKGYTLTVDFLGSTDATFPTTFRVDDVSILANVPNPVTPVLFGVGGPTSVAEGTTAQYSAIVVNCDGSVQPVTASWSASGPASISFSGLLLAQSVSADTSATVTGTYNGTSLPYGLTVVNVAPVFTSLTVSGPNALNENSYAQFVATANYSDGSSQTVQPIWSLPFGPGGISGLGTFTVAEVTADTNATVSASYTAGGTTHTASQQFSILNVPPPPTLTSLTITGPNPVNENSTAQYSALALLSDGSSQIVDPQWLLTSSLASISTQGLLTVSEVSSNTTITINANYMLNAATRTATNIITLLDVPPPRPKLAINVSFGQILLSWPTNFVGFFLESATNFPTLVWTSNQAPIAITNDHYLVTDAPAARTTLYRLRK